jgi:hypothetical protein
MREREREREREIKRRRERFSDPSGDGRFGRRSGERKKERLGRKGV